MIYLAQNNDIYSIRAAWSFQSTLDIADQVPQQPRLDTFLGAGPTQDVPRQIQYGHVRALETHTLTWALAQTTQTHTHTLVERNKEGRNSKIKPSPSNPLTRVIKDTRGLLCEALSSNLKHLNAEQLLPWFGFWSIGSPSGVLATAGDPAIAANTSTPQWDKSKRYEWINKSSHAPTLWMTGGSDEWNDFARRM